MSIPQYALHMAASQMKHQCDEKKVPEIVAPSSPPLHVSAAVVLNGSNVAQSSTKLVRDKHINPHSIQREHFFEAGSVGGRGGMNGPDEKFESVKCDKSQSRSAFQGKYHSRDEKVLCKGPIRVEEGIRLNIISPLAMSVAFTVYLLPSRKTLQQTLRVSCLHHKWSVKVT